MSININSLNIDTLWEIAQYLSPNELRDFIVAAGKSCKDKMQKVAKQYLSAVVKYMGMAELDSKNQIKYLYREAIELSEEKVESITSIPPLLKKYQNDIESDILGFTNALRIRSLEKMSSSFQEAQKWLNDPKNNQVLSKIKSLTLTSAQTTTGRNNGLLERGGFIILPKAIGKLTGLENLYLYGNQLTTLPEEELKKLPHLKNLNVCNNPLKKPLSSYLQQLVEKQIMLV